MLDATRKACFCSEKTESIGKREGSHMHRMQCISQVFGLGGVRGGIRKAYNELFSATWVSGAKCMRFRGLGLGT